MFSNPNLWLALLTLALVIVTYYYARETAGILKESQKTRKAVERQASAIEESNRLIMKQREDSIALGKVVVQSTIDTAFDNIEEWKGRIKALENSHVPLPSTIDLVPTDAQIAVYHAIHISLELPPLLSGALRKLDYAQRDIKVIIDFEQIISHQIRGRINSALDFMEMASSELTKAKKYLPQS